MWEIVSSSTNFIKIYAVTVRIHDICFGTTDPVVNNVDWLSAKSEIKKK